jgi:hypothetical protein
MVSKIRVSKIGAQSGGCAFSRGALYELLSNPIYVGEIRHKTERHPGQHEPIVGRELWEKAQQKLREQAAHPRGLSTKPVPSPLAGKLFDESGEPLYVCGATKHQRRYRYYVSRRLTRSSAHEVQDGWRLAALEIERSVVMATAQILKDHAGINAVLNDAGVSSADLASAFKAIGILRGQIESGREIEPGVLSAIERVDLRKDGFNLAINLAPLISHKAVPDGARLTITKSVPLLLKRRGVELRIVLKGEATSTVRTDPTLIKAIARGRRWFTELASNAAADTLEIAKREGLRDSYVRRLIPLALLAPAIVEAICAGSQPPDLTAEELTRRAELPITWDDQQRELGIGFGTPSN